MSTTSNTEKATILAEYAALKKHSAKEIRIKLQAQHRVTCESDNGKASDIIAILTNRHGEKRVQKAFAK